MHGRHLTGALNSGTREEGDHAVNERGDTSAGRSGNPASREGHSGRRGDAEPRRRQVQPRPRALPQSRGGGILIALGLLAPQTLSWGKKKIRKRNKIKGRLTKAPRTKWGRLARNSREPATATRARKYLFLHRNLLLSSGMQPKAKTRKRSLPERLPLHRLAVPKAWLNGRPAEGQARIPAPRHHYRVTYSSGRLRLVLSTT